MSTPLRKRCNKCKQSITLSAQRKVLIEKRRGLNGLLIPVYQLIDEPNFDHPCKPIRKEKPLYENKYISLLRDELKQQVF